MCAFYVNILHCAEMQYTYEKHMNQIAQWQLSSYSLHYQFKHVYYDIITSLLQQSMFFGAQSVL